MTIVVRYTQASWDAMSPDKPANPNDPRRILGAYPDHAEDEAEASARRMNSIPSPVEFEVVRVDGDAA